FNVVACTQYTLFPYTTLFRSKHGDRLSLSIAAASIVAKVTRDRMMLEYDKVYPNYGFKDHKGYGTKKHLEALHQYGASPIHRKTDRKSTRLNSSHVKISYAVF